MNFQEDGDQLQQVFDMAASCVKTIADENQIYDCKEDLLKQELTEWFEQLNSKQFGEIQKFFETMPKLSHTLKVTNPNTGKENEIKLEGLASFSHALLHQNLRSYYEGNFSLMHHHKWNIEHIDNLMPWKRKSM